MTFREETIGDCRLILGDCLEVLPTLGKVDAVVTDPPYYGVKREAWDNQWKSAADFLAWSDSVATAIRDTMEHNASLYWFASPQMASRIEATIACHFHILNNIVWDKSGDRKGIGGTGIDVTALRSYWSANTERLIFAERSDGDAAARDMAGYEQSCTAAKVSIFGDYLRSEFNRAGVTNKHVAALFPSRTGGLTGCVSNWLLGLNVPTSDQYNLMRDFLNGRNDEYLRRNDEYLRREYEDLRREYEDLRRPFYLTADDVWGDVWRFQIERGALHPTQKPLPLMLHILKASSRGGNTILDPFMGSGTTGVACARMGRKFIGIELEPKYFEVACKRIENAYKQGDLFREPPAKPVQHKLGIVV